MSGWLDAAPAAVRIAIAGTVILSHPALAEDPVIPISDFFGIKQVSGSRLLAPRWEGNEVFVRDAGQEPRYIGFTERRHAAVTYAVSKDGRSLAFRHAAFGARPGIKLDPGIYQYVYGTGPKLLRRETDLSGLAATNYGKPVPPDVLPFSYAITYSPRDLRWALRATGEEIPLALLDATPLHVAAFEGRTSECEKLISQGADPDALTYWSFTPLDLAIIRNHEDAAIRLLEVGAEPNGGRYPALHRAVMLGRMKVVQAMLARGADVNGGDEHGYTPLHLAVFAGSRLVGGVNEFFPHAETPRSVLERDVTVPLVRMLLEKGANPALRDRYGETALGSMSRAAPEEAKRLLQAVSPDAGDPCDDTLLYRTADAHPDIRWISPRRDASGSAALGCVLRSAQDDADIDVAIYMSSGLYRFLRECRQDADTLFRLFEYKDKARPYLLRLHKDLYVEPRTYIVVRSQRYPIGAYHHSLGQVSNDASRLTSCLPDG